MQEWIELVLSIIGGAWLLAKVIVEITPSKKDDEWLGKIGSFVSVFISVLLSQNKITTLRK